MTLHHHPESRLLDHCPEGLPAHAYYDPTWFAAEQKAIWARNWVYAGRKVDLTNGTMRRLTIAGVNVILCRDPNGAITAFHNTCRHRGAELCSADVQAMGKLITCPYHAWSYTTSGRLISTAHATPTGDFVRDDHALFPVAVKDWNGGLFLCLADTPPDLSPDLGLRALDNWPMDSLITGHRLVKDLACNWKLFWENYNECLHCPGIHPELCDLVPIYSKGIMTATEAADWTPETPRGPNLKPGAASWTATGKPCGPEFPNLTADQRANGYNFVTIYPTMFVVGHVDYVRCVSLQPTGPETTRLTAEWLFLPETLAQPGFDAAEVAAFATLVMTQDAAAAEMNQRGVKSPKFTSARLMPQEFDIVNFHRWLGGANERERDMTVLAPNAYGAPETWDRRGLPGWTYHSDALFDLERTQLFLTHWQLAGHTADITAPGDWLSFDLLGERAVVMRGQDGVVRAFHNLCRHRGARVVDGSSGNCKSSIVCPFHGWVYNLDGTLRGAAQPESFGAMDRSQFGLKPIEMQIWHGFIFLRFAPGPQPDVATWLAPYAADFAAFRLDELVAVNMPSWQTELPVNWKSVRDVDNEGYHVPLAHPALQELYGRSYTDTYHGNGLNQSNAAFGDRPGRRWSVRNYVKLSAPQDWQPPHLQKAWVYYGLFPNAVITFTPESVQFYQEIPLSAGLTRLTGRLYRRPDETRQIRAARYLALRIDRETSVEDQQLSIWSNESMKSSAFDNFHLSDLEYGVRLHHDMLRGLIPVMTQDHAPPESEMAALNAKMLDQSTTSDRKLTQTSGGTTR